MLPRIVCYYVSTARKEGLGLYEVYFVLRLLQCSSDAGPRVQAWLINCNSIDSLRLHVLQSSFRLRIKSESKAFGGLIHRGRHWGHIHPLPSPTLHPP